MQPNPSEGSEIVALLRGRKSSSSCLDIINVVASNRVTSWGAASALDESATFTCREFFSSLVQASINLTTLQFLGRYEGNRSLLEHVEVNLLSLHRKESASKPSRPLHPIRPLKPWSLSSGSKTPCSMSFTAILPPTLPTLPTNMRSTTSSLTRKPKLRRTSSSRTRLLHLDLSVDSRVDITFAWRAGSLPSISSLSQTDLRRTLALSGA
jgi:hypothetical protein